MQGAACTTVDGRQILRCTSPVSRWAWRVDVGRDHVPLKPRQDLPHLGQSNNLNSSTPSFPHFSSQTLNRLNPESIRHAVARRLTPCHTLQGLSFLFLSFFKKGHSRSTKKCNKSQKHTGQQIHWRSRLRPSEIKPTQPKTKMEKRQGKLWTCTQNRFFSKSFRETVQWDKPRVRQQSDLYNIMVAAWRVICESNEVRLVRLVFLQCLFFLSFSLSTPFQAQVQKIFCGQTSGLQIGATSSQSEPNWNQKSSKGCRELCRKLHELSQYCINYMNSMNEYERKPYAVWNHLSETLRDTQIHLL